MTKCPNCGAYIPDGGKICIACGHKPEKEERIGGIFSDENPYINYLQQVMDALGEDDSIRIHDDGRWTAALSYLGPAFIYTYIKNRDNELVCFHANQACLLFAAYLGMAIFDRIPLVGGLIKKAGRAGLTALAFVGAKNAVANKKDALPIIGELGITVLK